MRNSDGDVRVKVVTYVRGRVGKATYKGNALLCDAPHVFNCFLFTQWIWGRVGVKIPDHQLLWPCAIVVPLQDIGIANLVFVPRRDRTLETDDFGHVGIATGDGTVVHATKWRNGVVEDPMEDFIARGCLGVRRVPSCRSP